MEFRVLGDLEVFAEGRVWPLGGHRQASILASLLVEPNRAVTADRLLDALWPDCLPTGARSTLQGFVHRLRRALPHPVISTTAAGYQLNVEPGWIDSRRFEELVHRGHADATAGNSEPAVLAFDAAFALWRGVPFDGFEDIFEIAAEQRRLDEIRLVAIEVRIDCVLMLGRVDEAAAELQALTHRYPWRERFWEQLVASLGLAGRGREARDACTRAAATLGQELGTDPAATLAALQTGLRQLPAGRSQHTISRVALPVEVRYAATAGGWLAYQSSGTGPHLIATLGAWTALAVREHPLSAGFVAELEASFELTVFDARGVGLSDGSGADLPSTEERAGDVIAVMDAAGLDRAIVYAANDAGPAALWLATHHPDRVTGLVLHNTSARLRRDGPAYPFGFPERMVTAVLDAYRARFGTGFSIDFLAPDLADDAVARRWWAYGEQRSGRRSDVLAVTAAAFEIDARSLLPLVTVPTLVLHSRDNRVLTPDHGRYMADHIPGATFVELPGSSHATWIDPTPAVNTIRAFADSVA